GDLRSESGRVQVTRGISDQNKHSAENIHHHSEDSQREYPVHGGERHGFPEAQHAQRNRQRRSEYQREAEEMHRLPGHEPNDMVDQRFNGGTPASFWGSRPVVRSPPNLP